MVKIEKNGKRMEVSSAAFHGFYEDAGWMLVSDYVPDGIPTSDTEKLVDSFPEDPDEDSDGDSDDDDWEEVLVDNEPEMPEGVEKPISQMNHDELMQKAERLGLDVSDNPSNAKLRERIRNA